MKICHLVFSGQAQVQERRLLRQLNEQYQKTILMVTHDMAAAQQAKTIVHMDKGRLGSIEQLR